jgi:WhiB family redox-sensing transcriptional regulator
VRSAHDTTWQDRALCFGDEPDLYYPEGDSFAEIPPAPEVVQARADAAKDVCSRCPVRAECLAFALANGEEFGVWGGMEPDERFALLHLTQTAV